MVAKIITGKSIRGALSYNEHKVREGQAELILASRFLREPEELTFREKLERFERRLEKSPQVKTNTLHISLNFDIGEKLELERLQAIATHYMDKIGFSQQPYLVYRHHDAAHPHLHIVTTNIRSDGSRIDLHHIGRLRSEPARKEIELAYGLVQAERMKNTLSLQSPRLAKAVYGKSETKRSISNIVSAVTRQYNYTSLTELNAVLRCFGVTADRGGERTQMHQKKGLLYSIINEKGEKQGVPIKASLLPGKPTLAYLEKQFEKNKLARRPYQLALRHSIDKIFRSHPNISRESFIQQLGKEEIQVLFRENSQGITYGVTYIDHKHQAVFNGSQLGKAYSAKAITERFTKGQTTSKEQAQQPNQLSSAHKPASNFSRHETTLSPTSRLTEVAGNILDELLQARQQDEMVPHTLRQKRRKRRRKPRL